MDDSRQADLFRPQVARVASRMTRAEAPAPRGEIDDPHVDVRDGRLMCPACGKPGYSFAGNRDGWRFTHDDKTQCRGPLPAGGKP